MLCVKKIKNVDKKRIVQTLSVNKTFANITSQILKYLLIKIFFF